MHPKNTNLSLHFCKIVTPLCHSTCHSSFNKHTVLRNKHQKRSRLDPFWTNEIYRLISDL
nr:MAG TPA: hypothetical protein [Caudoviricetes sp.]